MADPSDARSPAARFSEKGFYLNEFRGRTLVIAAEAPELRVPAPVESVLKELESNATRAVLISTARGALEGLLGTRVLSGAQGVRLEGAVWRALQDSPRAGLLVEGSARFGPACREIALRLGISKLVWLEREGGLVREAGGRLSFVDLAELRALLERGGAGQPARRTDLLREIEAMLNEGLPAVNLCTAEGLADELFSYAGSGTLFTRERYIEVRRLGLDDFDAAADLIERGVAEGYLAARSPQEVERVLGSGFGAFIEGRYLAGVGALLDHPTARAGEIVSLYTLTRFLGEGVGGHLVAFARERARERGHEFVFACTTAERVAGFFERQGFRRVAPEEIPPEKWQAYDPARRSRVHCLRRDLG
ncbi:MAG: GNAT family N-acetyltransferase [Myxococcota bacterium]